MRFRVAPEVFERFPDACVGGVVAFDVHNSEPGPAVADALRAAEAEARERLGADDLKAHPFIARWREAYRAMGLNPNTYKGSVEALLARVLKGGTLPTLSLAVDLANAVSLRSLLPAGAHDLDRLTGDLQIRVAREGEPFHPIGGGPEETAAAGEIVYADDAEVRTRRWIWRQGDRAKVTPASVNIFFPIDGWLGLNEEDVREAARTLARHVQEQTGARTATLFVHAGNPEVELTAPENAGQAGQADGHGVGVAAMGQIPAREPDEWDEIDDLLTRGVVDVIVRADIEKRLRAGEKLRVKLGIDPTGPRLHLGRAVPLRKLRRFQELGHTVCLVIGDFTAQVGDVSGHTAARRHLTDVEIYQNMATYKEQIGRILDLDRVEWSYNSDWLGQLRLKDVIGLSHLFTVQQMLARENFSLRYAEGKPIGLHEFFYPLMQGYDSYALDADLELGGTDQLFNLMAGREVQRGFLRRPQDVMTMQMIWGLDGRQMSTSEGNTVLLDEPAVAMYGKIMSMGDEHIVTYFEAATGVPIGEVRALARELADGLNPIVAKKRLAYEITRLYHGDAGAADGQRYFEELHQGKGELDDEDWPEAAIAGVHPRQVGALFKEAGLVKSNSEARQMVTQGGLEIDGDKVADFAAVIVPRTGMKLRRGKNTLARLRIE